MSSTIWHSIQVMAKALRIGDRDRRGTICLMYALAAALAVLSWQAATAHFNYGGNWTALFMTGELHPAPPQLAAHTYVFKDSRGFDGQFHRYVANAPWLRADWARFYDAPRVRHERILIPALAWLLAAGHDEYVDGVYIGLILCSVSLGVYWLRCEVSGGCPLVDNLGSWS